MRIAWLAGIMCAFVIARTGFSATQVSAPSSVAPSTRDSANPFDQSPLSATGEYLSEERVKEDLRAEAESVRRATEREQEGAGPEVRGTRTGQGGDVSRVAGSVASGAEPRQVAAFATYPAGAAPSRCALLWCGVPLGIFAALGILAAYVLWRYDRQDASWA